MIWNKGIAAGAVALTALLAVPLHGQAAWVASWGSAQQVPEPANALKPEQMQDATLREVVHLSAGGARLRVRLSNAFGTQPLEIGPVHVGLAVAPGSSGVRAETDRAVLFAGKARVTLPAGAEMVSDAVEEAVPAAADVAVSLYVAQGPAVQTGHPGARATTYVAHGERTTAAALDGAETVEHWYLLGGVEVSGGPARGAVVALGDSITDGHGATTNGNDRWPDVLARRVPGMGVVNAGIGGNHLLTDGLGPNVLARFDRDVLARPGVRTVVVLEGINDLGALSRMGEQPPAVHEALTDAMIEAYRQIADRAHAAGLRVLGGTVTPDVGSEYYHPAAANEADRQRVNAWIRTPGHFDGVVDFDRMVRDPARPERLLPAYDSGDHLHPSAAGYRVMGDGVSVGMLR